MNKRTVRAVIAAALAVGALTAVAAASAGSKAGAPIKLYVSAAVASGTQNYPDSQAGAEAAAAAINKAGGIKGRQIQILFCNNQSVSATAVNCARQAVDAGVVAVVGHVTSASTFCRHAANSSVKTMAGRRSEIRFTTGKNRCSLSPGP